MEREIGLMGKYERSLFLQNLWKPTWESIADGRFKPRLIAYYESLQSHGPYNNKPEPEPGSKEHKKRLTRNRRRK